MFQQITLIGHLGNDPEMRYTPSGIAVTNFSLAVNKYRTGQDGQREEKTMWFRIAAWRRNAETASQYLTKGSKVLIVGELEEARIYTDRNGNPQVSLEVTAQTIKFLSGRGETATSGNYASDQAGAAGNSGNGESELTDEDIPF